MAVKLGVDAAVKLGTSTVSEIGIWKMSGFTREVIGYSSFGARTKYFEFGIADGGTITFDGNFDPGDTTGQAVLNSACKNHSKITNLRLYVDNTSYFTPDVTNDSKSAVLVTKCDTVEMDSNGIGKISFEAKVTGYMVLV